MTVFLPGGAQTAVQHVGLRDLVHAVRPGGEQGYGSGGGASVRFQQAGWAEVRAHVETTILTPQAII